MNELYEHCGDIKGDRQADFEERTHEMVVQEVQGWDLARVLHELDDCFGVCFWEDEEKPSEEHLRLELIERMVDREVSKCN